MPNEINKEFWQHEHDRQHDLFLHFSTVRMAVLAFLLPLGGVIMAQDEYWAGILTMGFAFILNLVFGAKAAQQAKYCRSIADSLKTQQEPVKSPVLCSYIHAFNLRRGHCIELIIQLSIIIGVTGFALLVQFR